VQRSVAVGSDDGLSAARLTANPREVAAAGRENACRDGSAEPRRQVAIGNAAEGRCPRYRSNSPDRSFVFRPSRARLRPNGGLVLSTRHELETLDRQPALVA